jgi:hypothetical protein
MLYTDPVWDSNFLPSSKPRFMHKTQPNYPKPFTASIAYSHHTWLNLWEVLGFTHDRRRIVYSAIRHGATPRRPGLATVAAGRLKRMSGVTEGELRPLTKMDARKHGLDVRRLLEVE